MLSVSSALSFQVGLHGSNRKDSISWQGLPARTKSHTTRWAHCCSLSWQPLWAEVPSRNAGGARLLAGCCEGRTEAGEEHGAPDRDRNTERANKGLQRTPRRTCP